MHSRFYTLYTDLFREILFRHEMENATPTLLPSKTECEILFRHIKFGDPYYRCKYCHGIFDVTAIRKWLLDVETLSFSECPKCKTELQQMMPLYFNIQPWFFSLCMWVYHFTPTGIQKWGLFFLRLRIFHA